MLAVKITNEQDTALQQSFSLYINSVHYCEVHPRQSKYAVIHLDKDTLEVRTETEDQIVTSIIDSKYLRGAAEEIQHFWIEMRGVEILHLTINQVRPNKAPKITNFAVNVSPLRQVNQNMIVHEVDSVKQVSCDNTDEHQSIEEFTLQQAPQTNETGIEHEACTFIKNTESLSFHEQENKSSAVSSVAETVKHPISAESTFHQTNKEKQNHVPVMTPKITPAVAVAAQKSSLQELAQQRQRIIQELYSKLKIDKKSATNNNIH